MFGSVVLFMIRPVDGVIAALGIAIIWISLLPWLAHAFYAKSSAVPFFPAAGTFYAVFFGLPVFTILLAWPDSNSILLYSRVHVGDIRAEVLLLAAASIFGMVCSFYIAYFMLKNLPTFTLPNVVSTVNPAPLYWVLLVVHQVDRIVPGWSSIPSAQQFFEPAGYVAFGGFYLLWRRGKLLRVQALLIFGLMMPLEIYLRLRLLYLTDILLMLIFAALLLWRERQFKVVTIFAVLGLLILSLYGTSAVMRYSKLQGLERVTHIVQVYVAQFVDGAPTFEMYAGQSEGRPYQFWGRFGAVVMRTSHIWVFHVVDTTSPEPIPYWNGATYRPVLTSFIPRVLYPSKPEELFGLEFGRRYGFLEPDQTGTSVNLPWLTELLANFGALGVVLGMPLYGLLLAFLDRVFNARDMSDPAFLIGLTLIFPLVYPESNFSVMTGSMILLFLAMYVFFVGGSWLIKELPTSLRRILPG